MGQEIFPVMRGGAGMGQEKSMRGGGEDPILRPRPAPLPSLKLPVNISLEVLFLVNAFRENLVSVALLLGFEFQFF